MTETALAARILAAALFESDHLVATGMLEHFARDSRSGDGRHADGGLVAPEQQDLAELDNIAGFNRDAVDPDHIFSHNAVLLTAGFDDCEHRFFLVFKPDLGEFRTGFLSVDLRVFLRT